MSLDLNEPAPLVIPERKRSGALRRLAVAATLLAAGFWAWQSLPRLARLWTQRPVELATLEVDRGDLDVFVTENGALESANNATVRCKVEALVGQTGGAGGQPGQGGRGGGGGGQGAQGTRGGSGGQGGQGGQSGQGGQGQQQQAAAKKAKPKGRPGQRQAIGSAAKSKAGAGDGSGAAASAGANANAGAAANAGAGNNAAAGGGGAGGAGANAGASNASLAPVSNNPAPVLRSFTYKVMPYMPLRPKVVAQAPPKTPAVDPAAMGGGGGRGGRGGGGGGQANPEKPGASRIISILPEGTRVNEGDVVCELDSAAFRDELQAQEIRYAQAKAWVEQARSLLEVNEITLLEYREGIYPQDVQLIRQYLKTCEIEYDRARRNLDWSVEAHKKGIRASAQLNADRLGLQEVEIALKGARVMQVRLEKFTGPKLLKSLEAKIQAIKADKLAQEEAFQRESDRLKKLRTMVANCTLRAPREGIVVYAAQSNLWGRVENQIQEGVTVREGQPIFNLPDPNHMQVKARINETKVAQVRSGMAALVRVDAFPDHLLRGVVSEVTPIPAPANGPFSDVRIYYAIVKIEEGFDALRPGLSAEVALHVVTLRDVTRVPLEALREVDGQTFAAIKGPASSSREGPSWRWVAVKLGPSDAHHAAVVSGLKPGDKVVAHPESLPAPEAKRARAAVASLER